MAELMGGGHSQSRDTRSAAQGTLPRRVTRRVRGSDRWTESQGPRAWVWTLVPLDTPFLSPMETPT